MEDLTTDEQSKIRFANAQREAGAIVNHTSVVLFHGVFPGAFETLAWMDIQLHHLCTWWDVLEACKDRPAFNDVNLSDVRRFLEDPVAWSAAHGGISSPEEAMARRRRRIISTKHEQNSVPLSDASDRPAPGPNTLVIRAAFVPDGEEPPPAFASQFNPLRFRATLNREPGELTCDEAGNGFDNGILAQWYPDGGQASAGEGAPEAQGSGTEGTGGSGDGMWARTESDSDGQAGTTGVRPATLTWQAGFIGDAVTRAAPFGAFARAAGRTATDAGVAGGDGAAALRKKGSTGRPAAAKPAPGAKGGSPDFNRFFNTLDKPVNDLATELGVPEDYLPGHAAHESSYLNDHNYSLNNPFGYTAAGKNNLSFASVADAIAAYRNRYGEQIRGATSAKDFVERIQGRLNGKPVPGWYKYNSIDQKYEQHVLGLIQSIPLHKPESPRQKEPVR